MLLTTKSSIRKQLFLFVLFALALSFSAVAQSHFLQSLQAFCGHSYKGKVVFPEEEKNPFKGQPLSIHFRYCAPDSMRIPFTVGADASRTWVLSSAKEGLLLKHDHRHTDGTPDSITHYGGYAVPFGTPLQQQFPADAYTAKLIPAAATNEWTMLLSDDKKTFSYILKRDNVLRFRADFDLTQPF